ncbi:MAG TPA: cation diffusion facilitator family transporter [Bacteroidia bacterium]|nr:cation transporter [Bacteroidia bacterium]HMU77189.1 cation diffusion facilitator family transporter [Bacteroidia bacterium]HMX97514.1 cation diffusion facilitator family transporter [Bacteroidia bacterium]HNH67035.1 cation diffusion facilitator family transporter [Bacteroidia bacterium]HNN10450.1 cation diffusion facilitator family transporter [Bacteroidia bacterium]
MSNQKAIQTTWISIIGNTLLAGIKWIVGYFGNSYALIADAIESTTDIFSSILVLLGLKYASRPADKNHPYGHGRVEPLITFVVVGILVSAATVIAIESIKNIRTPHQIPETYTLAVLAVIIVSKELFYRIVSKRNKKINSSALKADAWHHRSDAITSLAAFIGIAIAIYLGDGYEAADDWAALVASGFIFYNSYLIFRPALGEIMDEHLYDDVVKEIREVAGRVEGVIDTEKCYVRKTGINFFVDLHVTVNSNISVKAGHQIAHHLKDALIKHNPLIADVLIHVEPDEHD